MTRTQNPTHKSRLWLSLPFVLLITLAGIYYIFWSQTTNVIVTSLTQAGLNAETITRSGFPARMSLELSHPSYKDPSLSWQSDELRLDFMPYNQNQAVIKTTGRHRFKLATGEVNVDYSENLASARIGLTGLERADFVLKQAIFSGYLGRVNLNMASENTEIHLRKSPQQTDMAEVAFMNDSVRIGRKTALDQVHVLAHAPLSWVTKPNQWVQDLRQGHYLEIDNIKASGAGFVLSATGRLGADRADHLVGHLDIELNDLSAFLKILQQHSILDARAARELEMAQGISKLFRSLSGKNGERKIKIPLEFKNGISYLAHIPLGKAPRLPLPRSGG